MRCTWRNTSTCARARHEVLDKPAACAMPIPARQHGPRGQCSAFPAAWKIHAPGTGWAKASPAAVLVASSPYAKHPTWPLSHDWLTGTGTSALRCSPDPPAATRAWQRLGAALTTGPVHHHGCRLGAQLSPGPPPGTGASPRAFPQSHFSLGLKARPRLDLGSAP